MTSQTAKQIITIHLLPNISRNKNNHTMQFSQLTAYKITTFGKSYTQKTWSKLVTDPFYPLYLISSMILVENHFSRYILLTDQISLLDCLYVLRYFAICVL